MLYIIYSWSLQTAFFCGVALENLVRTAPQPCVSIRRVVCVPNNQSQQSQRSAVEAVRCIMASLLLEPDRCPDAGNVHLGTGQLLRLSLT